MSDDGELRPTPMLVSDTERERSGGSPTQELAMLARDLPGDAAASATPRQKIESPERAPVAGGGRGRSRPPRQSIKRTLR